MSWFINLRGLVQTKPAANNAEQQDVSLSQKSIATNGYCFEHR